MSIRILQTGAGVGGYIDMTSDITKPALFNLQFDIPGYILVIGSPQIERRKAITLQLVLGMWREVGRHSNHTRQIP